MSVSTTHATAGMDVVRHEIPGRHFLSAEGCQQLFARLRRLCRGGGELHDPKIVTPDEVGIEPPS